MQVRCFFQEGEAMKKCYIFAGNYGSGKTELSLNMALRLKEEGKTVLCDMDVVNPYFRSAEQRELLEAGGIRLIAPPFANTAVDVPALSAEVKAAFEYDFAIFDAGGDPVGAAALGGFRQDFERIRDAVTVYYVINARRPFQENVEDAVVMLRQIEANMRLSVDALINNTNLSKQTTAADLVRGEELCGQIARETGILTAFASGKPEVIEAYRRLGYSGKTMPLQIFTHPAWMDAEGFDANISLGVKRRDL